MSNGRSTAESCIANHDPTAAGVADCGQALDTRQIAVATRRNLHLLAILTTLAARTKAQADALAARTREVHALQIEVAKFTAWHQTVTGAVGIAKAIVWLLFSAVTIAAAKRVVDVLW